MNHGSETHTRILQPGDLYLSRSPAILQTILGSCVGVTFWSRRLGAGALCHGVLPCCPPNRSGTYDSAEARRYVDFSIRYLARQFDALGARRAEVEIKVFGGADVLPVHPDRSGRLTVGAQNSRAALDALGEEGLAVIASDLGGPRGRQVLFYTETGDVLVRRLDSCRVPCP
jgi:chemotaxis protein CheD